MLRKGDTKPVKQEINYSEKSYWILILCFYFFLLGAQQFYLGNRKAGFIRLGCSIILIGLPINLILTIKDLVQLCRGKLYDSKGLPAITPQHQSKKMRKKIQSKSEKMRKKIQSKSEKMRKKEVVLFEDDQLRHLRRKAQEKRGKKLALLKVISSDEVWASFNKEKVCIDMHIDLVEEIKGTKYEEKRNITKDKTVLKYKFGRSENLRGNWAYDMEITFVDNRVTAFKDL